MKYLRLFLVFLAVITLASCNKKTEEEKTYCNVSFIETDQGGYKLSASQNGSNWETKRGAFGILIGYDHEFDVSDILYSDYSSFEKINDKEYTAQADLTTPNGSVFQCFDEIIVVDNGFELERTVKVVEANELDLGYMTYFTMENNGGVVQENKWFCPAIFYGDEEWSLLEAGVKSAFTADRSVVAADSCAAPVLMMYSDDNSYVQIMDKTKNQRMTTVQDTNAWESKILYSSYFDIPAIGMANTADETIQMFHCYPAETYNFIGSRPFCSIYRLLPLEVDETQTINLSFTFGKEETFIDAVEESWLYAYDFYAYKDARYDVNDVEKAQMEWLYNSFGYIDGVPQLMTTANYHYTESGFLYRNVDNAFLLLEYGRKHNLPDYVEKALIIMDYHVEHDLMDDNMVFPFDRSRADAFYNLTLAFEYEKARGINHANWLNYLIEKANERLEYKNEIYLAFFTEIYRATKINKYLDTARNIAAHNNANHSKMRFNYSVQNPQAMQITEKESAMIALTGYLNLYEFTNEEQYLEMAKISALFVETNTQLQGINMNPVGTTGLEYIQMGYLGNEKIKGYGLNFICPQATSADPMSMASVPDYYRLYKITNNEHYKDVADLLAYNLVNFVNMGDKVYRLADSLQNTGIGWVSEYYDMSVSTDTSCIMRGCVHTSTVGWLSYVYLFCFDQMHRYFEDDFSWTGLGDYNVAWVKYKDKISDDEYRVNLEEVCKVSSGEFEIENATYVKYSYSYSPENVNDYKDATKEGNKYTFEETADMRYVFIKTDGEIKDVVIMGKPYMYENKLNNASVINTKKHISSLTDYDFTTLVYFSNNEEYIIDLGSVQDIFEFHLTAEGVEAEYSIYVSEDGVNYTPYISKTSSQPRQNHYRYTEYAKCRYVKIVPTKSLTVQEMAFYGIEN